MSTIKSFSVGDGDIFYIKHNSDNVSIIDCCLAEEDQKRIAKWRGSAREWRGN